MSKLSVSTLYLSSCIVYGVSFFFFFEKKINLNKSLDIYCYSGVSRRVQPVLHSVETIFNWVPSFVMPAIFPILETTSKETHIPSTSSYESNSKMWTETATRRPTRGSSIFARSNHSISLLAILTWLVK